MGALQRLVRVLVPVGLLLVKREALSAPIGVPEGDAHAIKLSLDLLCLQMRGEFRFGVCEVLCSNDSVNKLSAWEFMRTIGIRFTPCFCVRCVADAAEHRLNQRWRVKCCGCAPAFNKLLVFVVTQALVAEAR